MTVPLYKTATVAPTRSPVNKAIYQDTDQYYDTFRGGRQYDVANGYGADPTGVADATSAIQAAITDACTANNGGVVYIPGGLYKITSTLNVTADGISIIGDGPGTEQTTGQATSHGTVLKVFTPFTGTSVLKFGTSPFVRPLAGANMRGIAIDGNSNAGSAIDGVWFSTFQGYMSQCNVNNVSGVGVRVIGATGAQAGNVNGWTTYDTRLSNVIVGRCSSHGVFFDVKSTDAWYVDGTVFYNVGHGVYVTSSGVHVHGVHSYSNQGHGVYIFQVGRCTVMDGYHENNYLAGVNVDGSTSIRVEGNSLYGNGRGADGTHSNFEVANTTGSSVVVIGNVVDTDPANNNSGGATGRPLYGIDLPSGQAQSCIVQGNLMAGTYANTGNRRIHDNGSGGYNGISSATVGTECWVINNPGFNPRGESVAAPGLGFRPGIPATTTATVPNNCFNEPATVYLTAGTSAVTVGIAPGNSTTITALTIPANATGTFRVMPGQAVTLTYTGGSPNWLWFLD